jgi:Holliday junction DNA helicase RuvA
MISYLRGEIAQILDHAVVLEVNSIGFLVYLTGRDLANLPGVGKEVKIHTYFLVKEDAMQLYGFLNPDDLGVYKLLLSVNGIGPKAAMGILSALTADDIRFAVLSGDDKTISKAPGIGKKTAQKLILELKDKFSLEEAFEKRNESVVSSPGGGLNDAKAEAAEALTALGYSNADALRAVKKAAVTEEMDTEEILKAALKNLSFM